MLVAACILVALAQTPKDSLAANFKTPPLSARPHTWWHWMSGNVTKEGITADLEAMKAAGIGGAQMFTVDQGIPAGPAGYNSKLWRSMINFAIKEANRLGLELCIHNCAGWSSSGGPWITPANAMQVIAWSEKKVEGPTHFDEVLPQAKAPRVYARVNYYKDIAVFAYRTPAEGDTAAKKPDDLFLGKTGVIRYDGIEPSTVDGPAGLAIPHDRVIMLTSKVGRDGRLTWDVPEGNWTILRMGHVPTGKDNHPAPPEGDGLEVDKLSKEALDTHWAGMMAKVIAEAGPLAGKVLNNSLIDSYEVGSQNWTPKFREEFMKRRGYDPLPWLPTIAGVVIDSQPKTDRFLWDVRRTIADLYADNYYGYFGTLCHQNGMLFSTEPYGNGGFDNIQSGGLADIPMGEFWVGGGTLETTKLASSAAHVYGHKICGAESFTADDVRGKFLEEPYAAKTLGDMAFANGINRYIFHRYAMQPWIGLDPGMTMGPWGTHLERTQTWWTEAHEWLRYVARCQYLLQSGHFVADALYVTPETAPTDLPYLSGLTPRLPSGYDYDGIDAPGFIKGVTFRNGRIVAPGGMEYHVLVLPDSKFMTPQFARKVRALVQAGATVVGQKPNGSPSLSNYPTCDVQVQNIANELWSGSHRVQTGSLGSVLNSMHVAPDFEFKSLTGGSKLVRIHRKIGAADVYFVSNQAYKATEAECTFRIANEVPELWHADTGQIETAPVYRNEGGRTVVPLRFNSAESVFVVFRHKATRSHLTQFGPVTSGPVMTSTVKVPIVVIKSARYESADGQGADVTAKVAELVKEGQLEIPATNTLFGDPAVNIVKHLVIEYEVDGKPMKRTVGENETMTLVDMPDVPVGAATYLLSSSGGRNVLTAWRPGVFAGVLANGRRVKMTVNDGARTQELTGGWHVLFQPKRGAPPAADFPELVSWPDRPEFGIKYFSGSATYQKDFTVSAGMLGAGRAVLLDLGRVKNFATVKLNGHDLGILWKPPFTMDVAGALRTGRNHLEVKVTNLWPNRMIGDEHLPDDAEWNGNHLKKWPDWLVKHQPRPQTGRVTFATWKFWSKDSPLLESGLIGPVTVRSAKRYVVGQ